MWQLASLPNLRHGGKSTAATAARPIFHRPCASHYNEPAGPGVTLGEKPGREPTARTPAVVATAVPWKMVEFIALFAGLPCLIYLGWLPNWPIPLLLTLGALGWTTIRRDRAFDRSQLWNFAAMRRRCTFVLLRSLVLALLMGVVVAMFMPTLLFSWLKHAPMLWAASMLLYPILSVYPQEFLYRTLFFHRYRNLFSSDTALILASATAFGFVHLIFGAWLPVALSFVGGLLFALTYSRTKSLLLVSIEHAILGNAVFTVGLGQYFYHGGKLF